MARAEVMGWLGYLHSRRAFFCSTMRARCSSDRLMDSRRSRSMACATRSSFVPRRRASPIGPTISRRAIRCRRERHPVGDALAEFNLHQEALVIFAIFFNADRGSKTRHDDAVLRIRAPWRIRCSAGITALIGRSHPDWVRSSPDVQCLANPD